MRSYLKVIAATFCGLMLLSISGCYQRTIAPAIQYDQSEVEQLDEEINNLFSE